MTDGYEPPIATGHEAGGRHSILVGREPEIIEQEIQRMTLKEIVGGFVQLKAARLIGALARRVEDRPLPSILIALGAGLIAGEVLRRKMFSGRR